MRKHLNSLFLKIDLIGSSYICRANIVNKSLFFFHTLTIAEYELVGWGEQHARVLESWDAVI